MTTYRPGCTGWVQGGIVMLVFLDTEFTKFTYPDLISLAQVSEDGRRIQP